MAGYRVGQKIHSTDFSSASVIGNGLAWSTTSATYVPVGTVLQFTVPRSGAVEIEICGDVWNSSATDHAYLSVGAVDVENNLMQNPADSWSVRTFGQNGVRASSRIIFAGMTAGVVGTASLYGRTSTASSTTAWVWQTRIIIRAA